MSHYGRFQGGVPDEVFIARFALKEDDLKRLMREGILKFTSVEPGGKFLLPWGKAKVLGW